MKKFKILIYSLLLIISVSIFSNTVKAIDEAYLQAKDYIILVDGKDNSKEIEKFLTICKDENKDAYFNDGIYILKESITLVDDVSLIGAEQTIFRGINGDYQVNIFDGENTKDITIKNIIFDNVTIYSQNANSTNWSIEENIFINAKKVDINIDSGLKPDSNNKNGGELTGYYILKSKTNGNISSNLFLRDENSLGRGIAVYKSYDFTINDNYFGLIADIDNSIVSDKDLLGQPQLIDVKTILFTVPLTSKYKMRQLVTLKLESFISYNQAYITEGDPNTYGIGIARDIYKMYSGVYRITKIQHVLQSRNTDVNAWCTNITAVEVSKNVI